MNRVRVASGADRDGPTIEAVIFDIGRVLVEPDYAPFLRLLANHGAPFASMDDFCAAVDLDAHEAGDVDGEAFLRRIEALVSQPIGRATLVYEWNAMYAPVRPLLDAARQLRRTHRVYLLSNMGEVHWAHLQGLLDVDGVAHDALASWAARSLKPASAIYAAAESRFDLAPARTVFVDDRADNAAAARARGWRAIEHVSPAATLAALARLGLPVHDTRAGA